MTPEPFVSGYRLIDGTELNDRLANPVWSSAAVLSATVGGDLDTSARLYNTLTNITTAAAPNAGVVLPQALEGRVLFVNNSTANDVVVFAEGDSTVNGIPGDVGDVLPAGKATFFIATDNLTWISGDFSGVTQTFTEGSVIFAGPTGALAQDNANFFWDNTGNFLGIGTDTPAYTLDVAGDLRVTTNATVGGLPVSYPGYSTMAVGGEGTYGDLDLTYQTTAKTAVSFYCYDEAAPANGAVSLDANKATTGQRFSLYHTGDASTTGLTVQSNASDPITFFTGSEKMRLTAAGNLGVGTASPSQVLHVVGNSLVTGQGGFGDAARTVASFLILSVGQKGVKNANVDFLSSSNRTHNIYAFVDDLYMEADAGALFFDCGTSIRFRPNYAEKMRLDVSGNLCLGTSSAGTSAARVLAILESTPPTTSPLGGVGQIYVEGGALKYRGAAGTITTIAPT